MLKSSCKELIVTGHLIDTVYPVLDATFIDRTIQYIKEEINPSSSFEKIEINIDCPKETWISIYKCTVYYYVNHPSYKSGNKRFLFSFYAWGYPSCCGLASVSGLNVTSDFTLEHDDPIMLFMRHLIQKICSAFWQVKYIQMIVSPENPSFVREMFLQPEVEETYDFINSKTRNTVTCNLIRI